MEEKKEKEVVIASEEETTKVLKKVIKEYGPLLQKLADYDKYGKKEE